MKEKLKKAFDAVFSWRGLMRETIIFAVVHLTAFLFTWNPIYLLSVVYNVAFACFAYAGWRERRAVEKACYLAAVYKTWFDKVEQRLLRYKKLYGDLPAEEETETNEEAKEEQP